MLGGRVAFDVPVDVAYAYLADPRNRPEWQSSLSSVEMLDEGEPRVGMRWRDHTVVGPRPADGDHDAGAGGAVGREGALACVIEAILTLGFEPTATGCVVDVRFRVHGRGLLAPVGWLATGAGVLPVLSDVRRAARILAERRQQWDAPSASILSALMVLVGLRVDLPGSRLHRGQSDDRRGSLGRPGSGARRVRHRAGDRRLPRRH